MVQWSRRRSSSGLLSCLFSHSTGYLFRSPFHLPSSTCDCDGGYDLMLQKNKSVRTRHDMTSPLRLLQVVEIATCLLGVSLKCGDDGNVVPARSLPMCSPKVSSVLSVRSVGLQGSSARTGPSSRRTRTCATRFSVCSSCCNRTSPCLMSLRSQNLCWFSQPLRFSQRWAMSAGDDACSPRDFTFLYCGAQVLSVPPLVWSRSTVPARPYRLSAVVDGGRLLKLRGGAISSGTRGHAKCTADLCGIPRCNSFVYS